MPNAKDEQALVALIETYIDAMQTLDPAAVTAFWEDDETVFYIAEEIDAPLIGRKAVANYWTANAEAMDRLGVKVGAPTIRWLSDDLAAALFRLNWSAKMAGPGRRLLGGEVKVVALLRRAGTGWVFCQWTESALGPLAFMTQAFRDAVDPQFAADRKAG